MLHRDQCLTLFYSKFFIHDVPNVSNNIKIYLFADDTDIYVHMSNQCLNCKKALGVISHELPRSYTSSI